MYFLPQGTVLRMAVRRYFLDCVLQHMTVKGDARNIPKGAPQKPPLKGVGFLAVLQDASAVAVPQLYQSPKYLAVLNNLVNGAAGRVKRLK